MFAKIWHNFKQLDYRYHVICAFLIRIFVIQYGKYHDENYAVPYTDIDYKVFTDAARHVLNYTSPYNRHTYRYTPFVAILLTPNILLHDSFGKLLFSVIDIVVALLIRIIVKTTYKEYEAYKLRQDQKHHKNETKLKLIHPSEEKQSGKRQCGGRRKKHKSVEVKKTDADIMADLSMLLWLYNPMTIAIATRGNCDSIAGLLVLSTLYFLQCKRQSFVAGLFHGVAVHVRLYPIAYSLAFFMYLSKFSFYSPDYRRQQSKKVQKAVELPVEEDKGEHANHNDVKNELKIDTKTNKNHKNSKRSRHNKNIENQKKEIKVVENKVEPKSTEVALTNQDNKKERKTIFKLEYLFYLVPNLEQFKLIFGCLLSLGLLTGIFYFLYGYQFLYESYVYHLTRKDTRHNFSLYFYLQYLTAGVKSIGIWQKVLTVLPQILLLLVFSVRYGLNKLSLNFAILTETIVMVSYNTVLTSQYFVWVLAVLPLCLWQIQMSKKTALFLVVIWFAAQTAWLLPAYFLEFQGHNTFLFIWIQSVSFYCANMAVLGRLVRTFMPSKSDYKIL